jgi:hypothetical protein
MIVKSNVAFASAKQLHPEASVFCIIQETHGKVKL